MVAADAFRAEIAAIAAAHKAKESGRIGDGMAAGSDDPLRVAGWMDFSGPRVPIEPDGSATGDVRKLVSARHVHTGGSDCLETVAGGIRPLATGESREVEEPGWVQCSHNGARYHLHGDRLMAHWIGNRLACPNGVQP